MATNRQVALEAAVQRYEGLRPTGQRSYFAKDLAKGPLKLADLFLEWLEKDEEPTPAKDGSPDGAEPEDLPGGGS